MSSYEICAEGSAIDSPWALQVKGHTVSKMSAKLPPVGGAQQ
jgi:hypothetical protein